VQRRSDWNHYAYTYGEGEQAREARVEFDVMAAVMPDGAGHTVRVVADEAESERVLEVLASVDGLHVGTLHYAGRCEQVLVVQQPLSEAVVASLTSAGGQVHQMKGWDYVNDRVAPAPADWRRITDREALQRLDLDGDGELRVLHRFVGAATGLRAVLDRLVPEGFEQVEHDPDAERLVLAHRHSMGRISEITVGLLRLSERHGVAYDGWVLPG
jgi:hypothetical protein